MKYVIYIALTIYLLFSASRVDAQVKETYLLDTVVFKMENHHEMSIIARSYHDLEHWPKIDSIFDLFLKDLERIENQTLNKEAANQMIYEYKSRYRKIRVQSGEAIDHEVSFDPNGDMVVFQVVEIEVNNEERFIFRSPTFDGFRTMAALDLDALVEESKAHVFEDHGKNLHIDAVLIVEEGKIVGPRSEIYGSSFSTIELTGIFGLGTVRTTLTPDIELRMMVNLSKKGVFKNQFGASYEFLFGFPENESGHYDVKADGFLNLIYATSDYNSKKETFSTSGLKVGMLMNSRTDRFKEQAYKAAIFHNLGKRMLIEAGGYFEDSFHTGFPYMRVSLIL